MTKIILNPLFRAQMRRYRLICIAKTTMWNVKITPIKQEKTTPQKRQNTWRVTLKNEDTVHKYKVLNFINNPGNQNLKNTYTYLTGKNKLTVSNIRKGIGAMKSLNTLVGVQHVWRPFSFRSKEVKPIHTLRPSASTFSYTQTKDRVQQGSIHKNIQSNISNEVGKPAQMQKRQAGRVNWKHNQTLEYSINLRNKLLL